MDKSACVKNYQKNSKIFSKDIFIDEKNQFKMLSEMISLKSYRQQKNELKILKFLFNISLGSIYCQIRSFIDLKKKQFRAKQFEFK